MALFIEITAADGLVSRTRLEPGNNRFTVRLGDSYRIFDEQSGLTPPDVAVKRVDNNLVVDGLGSADGAAGAAEATVEFAEFYSVCSAGSPCQLTVDQGAGAAPIAITPGTQPIGALADGSFVLHDQDFAETAPAEPSLGDDTGWRYALYGLGGAAVLGLAAGGGGGGGGDGGGGTPDGSLSLTSPTVTNSRTPTITGQGEPGAKVTVRIDTNGDGVADVTYGTTVAADFQWSVSLATAVPESGALPPDGLPAESSVGITSTTAGGIASVPTFVLAYDGTPPAPAAINVVAGDNVVNASESSSGVIVSGTAEAGATITVTWGQQVRSAVANGAGAWQTPAFDSASIPGNGDHLLTAVVQDLAGNNSTPTQLNVNVDTTPPRLDVSPVAGDGRVNALEAGSVAFTGSTDPNAAVSVTWNGTSRTGTADGTGNWSTSFSGGEVPNPGVAGGQEFPYSIAVTNVVGNVASASGNVLVDRVPPAAPAIGPVTPDNIINAAEAAAGVVVSGTGEDGSTILLNWGGRSASARVDDNGNWQANFASGNLPPDGNRTITAIARDDAGNETTGTSRVVALETGPAPLAVTSVGGPDGMVTLGDAGSAVFVGTAAANAAVSVVWNDIIKPTTADGTGGWTVTYSGTEVPTADNLPIGYFANTSSPAGNTNFVTGSVVVDTVAPAIPGILASQVVGSDFSATGTGTAGSTVTLEIDSTPLLPGDPLIQLNAPVDSSGIWQISQPIALPPLALTVTMHAFAQDQAGNRSATTADQNVPVTSGGGVGALDPSEVLASADIADIVTTSAGEAAVAAPGIVPILSSAVQVAALAPLDHTLDSYA